jgi:hypothetical protein
MLSFIQALPQNIMPFKLEEGKERGRGRENQPLGIS